LGAVKFNGGCGWKGSVNMSLFSEFHFYCPFSFIRVLAPGSSLLILKINCYLCNLSGPVVQLNRTSDSGSGSRGFESRRGHKKGQCFAKLCPFFMHKVRGSTGGISSGFARLTVRSESSRRGHKKVRGSQVSDLFLCERLAT
jgi:hypothetical protein